MVHSVFLGVPEQQARELLAGAGGLASSLRVIPAEGGCVVAIIQPASRGFMSWLRRPKQVVAVADIARLAGDLAARSASEITDRP